MWPNVWLNNLILLFLSEKPRFFKYYRPPLIFCALWATGPFPVSLDYHIIFPPSALFACLFRSSFTLVLFPLFYFAKLNFGHLLPKFLLWYPSFCWNHNKKHLSDITQLKPDNPISFSFVMPTAITKAVNWPSARNNVQCLQPIGCIIVV